MQEIWVQSLGQEIPLEQEMATHSSILAWEFHGQKSLVGYSPWGPKELDMTKQLTHTHTHTHTHNAFHRAVLLGSLIIPLYPRCRFPIKPLAWSVCVSP